MPREIELKLLFPAESRPSIEQHPALQDLLFPGRSSHLVATYYDTPDLTLSRRGLSLRVRREGGGTLQTVKSGREGGSSPWGRGEWEWPIEADQPDLALLKDTPAGDLVEGLTGALKPVLVSDICRTVRRIRHDGATIEVAIDEGVIRAAGAEEPVRELELELKDGPILSLYRLALLLKTDLPLRIGTETKAARGYRLLSGQSAEVSTSKKRPALGRKISAAAGFKAIIGAGLEALLANQAAAEAGSVEAVHQMRVAIRRLRTALGLFKRDLEPYAPARFDEALRQLGRILGRARDWDVFCIETLPAAFGAPEAQDWRQMLAPRGVEQRAAAHRELRETFAGPALTDIVLGLACWTEAGNFAINGASMAVRLSERAPELLDRAARKVHRRAERIDDLSAQELHALRKALRRLRFSAEFVSGLYARKSVERYVKRCKHLQEVLGVINDSAVATILADALGADHVDVTPACAALVRWCDEERSKALRRLPEAWEALRHKTPFWH
jgi:inorganic triphosphatase YgiF